MFDYALTLLTDENPGVAAICDDLPEFNSAGDDIEHLLKESIDGIETALSIYVDERRSIPLASPPKPGQCVVRLSAVTKAKIALWNAMIDRDMRKADLRRLLGVHQVQSDRLVDFLHTSKIEQVEDALRHLGLLPFAPYEPVTFCYAPHRQRDDFDKLRDYTWNRPGVTTEESDSIKLDTLAPDNCPEELRAALVQVIKDRFRHWGCPSIKVRDQKADGGILFNLSSMPVGMIPSAHWIKISPAELYRLDEQIYRDLLGLPKRSAVNA